MIVWVHFTKSCILRTVSWFFLPGCEISRKNESSGIPILPLTIPKSENCPYPSQRDHAGTKHCKRCTKCRKCSQLSTQHQPTKAPRSLVLPFSGLPMSACTMQPTDARNQHRWAAEPWFSCVDIVHNTQLLKPRLPSDKRTSTSTSSTPSRVRINYMSRLKSRGACLSSRSASKPKKPHFLIR